LKATRNMHFRTELLSRRMRDVHRLQCGRQFLVHAVGSSSSLTPNSHYPTFKGCTQTLTPSPAPYRPLS